MSDARHTAWNIKKSAHKRLERIGSSSNGTTRTLSWIVRTFAIGTVDIAIGIILIIITTGMKIYAMWPLVNYGLLFLFARFIFLLIVCPLFIAMADILVPTINALIWAMVAVLDVAITALDALFIVFNDVIDIINFIAGHKITSFSFPLEKWINNAPQISYSEFRNTFTILPAVCTQYDSMPKIVKFFLEYGLHDYTCPAVRFTWPLPTFYNILRVLLDFTYKGSAQPDPFNRNANCMALFQVTLYDFTCSGMGIGYLFLEFFLPAIILFIVIFAIGGGLLRVFQASMYSIYIALRIVLATIIMFFDIVIA